jgi:hypothetical protein
MLALRILPQNDAWLLVFFALVLTEVFKQWFRYDADYMQAKFPLETDLSTLYTRFTHSMHTAARVALVRALQVDIDLSTLKHSHSLASRYAAH